MTAVARPPRSLVLTRPEPVAPAGAGYADEAYVGRHRAGRATRRARHPHAAAAVLAVMLAWIPAAGAGRGRHRRG